MTKSCPSASILVGAFYKDKALVGKLLNFAKLRYQLYAAYICIVCCVVWPVSALAGFCEDYIWVTMSGHCECARAARHTMHRVHTAQGSYCFICRYYHGTQCGSGTLRGSHHVTITSAFAFSSQHWIHLPLNSYFLIVCKKNIAPFLSSPRLSGVRPSLRAQHIFMQIRHFLISITSSEYYWWLAGLV